MDVQTSYVNLNLALSELVIYTHLTYVCTDQRAVDGAYSAAFLRKLQSHIEETNWETELQRGVE